MEHETIKISTCCKRQAIDYDNETNKSMCSRCGLACKVTEVCSDCYGTGEIHDDQEDGEGHTMRGVVIRKCSCQRTQRDEYASI